MKKGIILIVLAIIIVIGAFYIILNSPSNNNNNHNNNHNNNNSTFILNTVALTQNDIGEDYQLIDENYWKDRNFTNATGNGITWKQIEHYQSSFIGNNTNGPITPYDKKNVTLQTITKLESKEKAELFVDLWIDGRQKKGYLNIPIEPIGDKSAYFYDIESSRDYDLDRYMICFSIDDIVVVVFNDGVNLNQSRTVDLAKIIENNILNLLY